MENPGNLRLKGREGAGPGGIFRAELLRNRQGGRGRGKKLRGFEQYAKSTH